MRFRRGNRKVFNRKVREGREGNGEKVGWASPTTRAIGQVGIAHHNRGKRWAVPTLQGAYFPPTASLQLRALALALEIPVW